MGTIGINILETENGGFYEIAVAGEDLKKGKVCYLSNDGKYYKTDTSDVLKCSTELRIPLQDVIANSFGNFLISGKFDSSEELVPGDLYYLFDDDGKITNILDDVVVYVRKIGTAYSNYILEFNPDETFIKKDCSEINKIILPTYSLVDEFESLPEATTLESSDKLMINRLVGGVPTLYNIEVDILSDKTFIFTQNTPSAIWNIQHDLTKYPSATVIDSALTSIEGQIEYIDINNIRITFCSPFSGTASLN